VLALELTLLLLYVIVPLFTLLLLFVTVLVDVEALTLLLLYVIVPVFTLLFVFTLVLVLTLVDALLTLVLLVLTVVAVLLLFVFTVLVDVEELFVSTKVFESYVVCATDDKDMTKSTIAVNFLIIYFPF
jgi:hypothetical protein